MRRARKDFPLWLGLMFMVSLLAGVCAAPAAPDLSSPAQSTAVPPSVATPPQRLISLAPSTTEIVFVLGLQDRLVGVTRYCDYPPAAQKIPRVGGFFDPSYEEIVALQPDLVILLDSHTQVAAELAKLGLKTLSTPHKTVADIPLAVQMIGAACGAPAVADSLATSLRERSTAVARAVAGLPRPRVLVCIGRDRDSGDLAGMHFAGQDGFYDALVSMAGGANALADFPAHAQVDFPQLSAEGVLQVDPDLILDLVSRLPSGSTAAQVAAQWQRLPACRAVSQGQVHVLVGDQALRPGPRYILFLEQLARLLHPEAFAEEAGPRKAAP